MYLERSAWVQPLVHVIACSRSISNLVLMTLGTQFQANCLLPHFHAQQLQLNKGILRIHPDGDF